MSVVNGLRSGVRLVPTALSVVAAVTLTLTPWRTAGFVLVGSALVCVTWRALVFEFTRTMAAQVVVLLSVLGSYPHTGLDPALIVGGASLTVLVVMQPTLDSVLNRRHVIVAHLAGYVTRRIVIPPNALYAANIALIATVAATSAAGLPAWVPLVPIAIVTVAYGLVTAQAVERRWTGSRGQVRFRAAIEHYQPAFALYFSAPAETEYHVQMWLPYLERVGRPFVVILRENRALAAIAATTSAPVIYCPTVSTVDDVVTTSMRACFYVNNGAKNAHMVRFNQMTHIQLLHGDSDKPSSFNPVTAMFDRIFVAGQAGIDRYAANGVPVMLEKFDIVGRPQVESVEVSNDHIRDVTDKVVLYASTWVGLYNDGNYCSLPIGETIVASLLERKATVILRPHPYADRHQASARQVARLQQMLAEDRDKTGREHVFGVAATKQMSLFECMNRADVLVCDVSGVASDFLQSNKPFALTDMVGAGPAEFAVLCPLASAAYVIDGDAMNIDTVLDDLFEDDPLRRARREIKAYYLGDFDEVSYADRFVSRARAYVDAPLST
jgi:hypothetical protein